MNCTHFNPFIDLLYWNSTGQAKEFEKRMKEGKKKKTLRGLGNNGEEIRAKRYAEWKSKRLERIYIGE